MTMPRATLVDPLVPLFYHLVSRCVRRSWLCGVDPLTGRDHSHRKDWLIHRIKQLAKGYSVEVFAYTVMSNHFHLVVYYDPLAHLQWSDEEVVQRWLVAHPMMRNGVPDACANARRHAALLAQPGTIKRLREHLGDLSFFMKHLKQPIAWRANREDDCRGHFFESRFYSGALLTDEAAIAAMAYVDLNPIRERVTDPIEQCANTSIHERIRALENSSERLKAAVAPLVPELQTGSPDEKTVKQTRHRTIPPKVRLPVTNEDYVRLLKAMIQAENDAVKCADDTKVWMIRVAQIHQRRHAFGSDLAVSEWYARRAMRVPKK